MIPKVTWTTVNLFFKKENINQERILRALKLEKSNQEALDSSAHTAVCEKGEKNGQRNPKDI